MLLLLLLSYKSNGNGFAWFYPLPDLSFKGFRQRRQMQDFLDGSVVPFCTTFPFIWIK